MPRIASKYSKSVFERKLVVMDKMISRSDVDRFEKVGNKPMKDHYDTLDKVYETNIDHKLPKLTHKIQLDKQV